MKSLCMSKEGREGREGEGFWVLKLTSHVKELGHDITTNQDSSPRRKGNTTRHITSKPTTPHHTTLLSLVILIGLSFGFGVFKNGFHKVKDHIDVCDPNAIGSLCGGGGKASRPFLGFPAPPPGPF
ncbi:TRANSMEMBRANE PROTEIN [Salix viminalis]|uniref:TRANSMEMBRANE PROTEIN n=1 Tax=Salix viminalis TaxID=40686 RepID=A0A9Q0Z7G1_SALVM|nr:TRANSMEMBRANE PROTEIN [Salix viminalis]